METFIISVLTSLIVTYVMMHYHIYKVNELYKKYMDFETSSVKKFAEDIISKLPKNSSQEEWWEVRFINKKSTWRKSGAYLNN